MVWEQLVATFAKVTGKRARPSIIARPSRSENGKRGNFTGWWNGYWDDLHMDWIRRISENKYDGVDGCDHVIKSRP
jgi:hypothetical protein